MEEGASRAAAATSHQAGKFARRISLVKAARLASCQWRAADDPKQMPKKA
jgi:hypothetical protein